MSNTHTEPRLKRAVFRVSRLLDFCTPDELTKQTGCWSGDWPAYIMKELLDNALDACEDAGIAPVVHVEATSECLSVEDNGPGLPPEVVPGVLDFTVHTSSRVGWVSPTRGAQGNALKHVVAIPYVLDKSEADRQGRVVIEGRGVRHTIILRVNHRRGCPEPTYTTEPCERAVGSKISVFWSPESPRLEDATKAGFFLLARGFVLCNPNLTLSVNVTSSCGGMVSRKWEASTPDWTKWSASQPTSAHWYRPADMEKLVEALLGQAEREGVSPITVGELVGQFRGLSGSIKRKAILAATGLSRATLDALVADERNFDHTKVAALLTAMKQESRPVAPRDLGIIGEDHVRACFVEAGCSPEDVEYRMSFDVTDEGLPQVTEVAFSPFAEEPEEEEEDTTEDGWERYGAYEGGFDGVYGSRRNRVVIAGKNWSPAIDGTDLFPEVSEMLGTRHAGHDRPVMVFLHVAIPRLQYTDQGKSVVVYESKE